MKYIVSYSGGKDSTATLLWTMNNYDEKDIIVGFCDTGWETSVTYEYVGYIKEFCKSHGVRFITLRNDLLFEDLIRSVKLFPRWNRRFCTQHLKVKQQVKLFKSINDKCIFLTGERKEESAKRKELKSKDFKKYKEGITVKIFRPILEWKEDDVFNYIKKHGLKVNPMYSLGFSRVGCAPCINARLKEIYLYYKHFPEQIEKIRGLEYELNKNYDEIKKTFFYRKGKITIDEIISKVIKKFKE